MPMNFVVLPMMPRISANITAMIDERQIARRARDLLGDVSTLNHEVAEWYDDPFVNNEAPLWAFPPLNVVCGDNLYMDPALWKLIRARKKYVIAVLKNENRDLLQDARALLANVTPAFLLG